MILQVKGLSKSFADKSVLDGVDFSLKEGQITALVGRNGSGKTTILKILARIYQEDEGDVLLDNRVIDSFPELKVHMAYLPDNFSFFDYDSIQGAMDYYRIIYPDFDEDFAQEELADLGLDPKVKIRSLSKGNKSLLGLIMVIATGADFLLVDEVLDGMDVLNKEKIMGYLLDAAGDGRSILVSSHELEELEGIADRILYLTLDGQLTDLEGSRSKIVKAQLVVQKDLPASIRDRVIIRQELGRVYTVLAGGTREDWARILDESDLVQYDFLEVRLEDIFYYEKGRGETGGDN